MMLEGEFHISHKTNLYLKHLVNFFDLCVSGCIFLIGKILYVHIVMRMLLMLVSKKHLKVDPKHLSFM